MTNDPRTSLAEREDEIWDAALRGNVGSFAKLCRCTAVDLSNASRDGAVAMPKP
jgi:hypothetical protein